MYEVKYRITSLQKSCLQISSNVAENRLKLHFTNSLPSLASDAISSYSADQFANAMLRLDM